MKRALSPERFLDATSPPPAEYAPGLSRLDLLPAAGPPELDRDACAEPLENSSHD